MMPIGIMQGRLLPPTDGRIQSFPVGRWAEELPLARAARLDCIEWIYEEPGESENPLATASGVEELRRAVQQSGVDVVSICADYYMTRRLVGVDGTIDDEGLVHLDGLLTRAADLGVRYVVLPFVDASSVRSPAGVAGLRELLPRLSAAGERHRVELHLETDLEASTLGDLMAASGGRWLRLNYDSGNSAALGYRAEEELAITGPWIGSFHVKDRVRGGGTVPLGTGDADVRTALRLALAAGFGGPLILQVAREEGIDEVGLAARNREWVEARLREIGAA